MKRDRSAVPTEGLQARRTTLRPKAATTPLRHLLVNDATGVVTQQLHGALSKASVGAVLSRAMTVKADSLVIQLETNAWDGTPVTRTLTWERVG